MRELKQAGYKLKGKSFNIKKQKSLNNSNLYILNSIIAKTQNKASPKINFKIKCLYVTIFFDHTSTFIPRQTY